jgi:ZIP family zinc transporter
MVNYDNLGLAFLLTLLAGLSTGVGSALAFFARRTNTKMLSVALGFSAGVMIYVSFVEIFVQAQEALVAELGEKGGRAATVASFFGGMLLIALIDRLVPHFENPHEGLKVEDLENREEEKEYKKRASLYRTGMFAALAIAIHNFPEGLATFAGALKDPQLGIPIAIAIAIHNIPEGIAVSIPIYYATHDRRKSFLYSFVSGLAEPLGAVVGFFLLMPFFNDLTFGVLFAGVGGIMVFISLDELLPAAKEYGESHLAIYGLISGMAVMAVSLLLFL